MTPFLMVYSEDLELLSKMQAYKKIIDAVKLLVYKHNMEILNKYNISSSWGNGSNVIIGLTLKVNGRSMCKIYILRFIIA
jgi:hypothetical protein